MSAGRCSIRSDRFSGSSVQPRTPSRAKAPLCDRCCSAGTVPRPDPGAEPLSLTASRASGRRTMPPAPDRLSSIEVARLDSTVARQTHGRPDRAHDPHGRIRTHIRIGEPLVMRIMLKIVDGRRQRAMSHECVACTVRSIPSGMQSRTPDRSGRRVRAFSNEPGSMIPFRVHPAYPVRARSGRTQRRIIRAIPTGPFMNLIGIDSSWHALQHTSRPVYTLLPPRIMFRERALWLCDSRIGRRETGRTARSPLPVRSGDPFDRSGRS
jgi:hypothetical protein